jgi:hypothetical protein
MTVALSPRILYGYRFSGSPFEEEHRMTAESNKVCNKEDLLGFHIKENHSAEIPFSFTTNSISKDKGREM